MERRDGLNFWVNYPFITLLNGFTNLIHKFDKLVLIDKAQNVIEITEICLSSAGITSCSFIWSILDQ